MSVDLNETPSPPRAFKVYEMLTYDGVELVRPATLPGMWERTISLGSAGKAFNATGWKIGEL